jgi:hypothetical protein
LGVPFHALPGFGHDELVHLWTQDRPAAPAPSGDPILDYALEELRFYETVRNAARFWRQVGELGALAASAATLILAGLHAPPVATALAAGAALFIGGCRQVFNPTERWITAVESWQRLRPAVRRYTLLPESERDAAARQALLTRIEEVAELEVTTWATFKRQSQNPTAPSLSTPPPAR